MSAAEIIRPIRPESDLLNLWARTPTDDVVPAHECAIGVRYTCPRAGCGRPMLVRAASSAHQQAHLYHVDTCASGESDEHRLAKEIIASRLRRWLDGAALLPIVGVRCETHRSYIRPVDVFFGATSVEVEGAVERRRADVLVRFSDVGALAVEVVHAHEVDADKAAELANAEVPWIEVDARQVVLATRGPWLLRRSSRRVDVSCPCCERDRARAEAADAVERTEQVIRRERDRQIQAQLKTRDVEAEISTANARREIAFRSVEAAEHQTAERQRRAAEAAREAEAQIEASERAYREALRPRRPGEAVAGDMPSPVLVLDYARWRDAAIKRETRPGEDPAWAALRLEAARVRSEHGA